MEPSLTGETAMRVLFYGVTHEHATGKLATLRRLADDYEVVAVVDDRARCSPAFHDAENNIDLSGLRVIAEDEAWTIPDVDVGFVETANCDLMEIAGEFISRGIPIHCDKPCGEAMEPYRSLVEAARARNLPFQIGYMYRGNPALRWIWKFVADGGLGDVRFIEADMNHNYQTAGYGEFLSSFKGGIFYNLGCHLVDMVEPMTSGELKYVDAHLETMRGTVSMRIGETEVLLRTQPCMPGSILSRRLRIDGTKGTIDLCPIERFDGGELKLTITPALAGSGGEIKFGVQTDRYAAQLSDLAAIVRGDKPNDQDYDRDLRVHQLFVDICERKIG